MRLVKENFIDTYEKSLLDFAKEFLKELGRELNIEEIPPIVLSLDTPEDATDIQGISIDDSDRLDDNPHGEEKKDAIDPKKKSLEDAASIKVSVLGRFIYQKTKYEEDFIFRGEKPLIEIYVRNFDNDLSMDDFNEYLRFVIAHEFFHYIHYLYDEKTLSDTSKGARIVCEASAEYFACLYLQKTSNGFTNTILKKRYAFWESIKSIYSYILCYLGAEDVKGVDDLIFIIEKSKIDVQDAYENYLKKCVFEEEELFLE